MNYLNQFIKSQRRRRLFSVINIVGLSICIGASLILFLYIRFELSYDSFHTEKNIYRVESRLYDGNLLTDNWATTTFGHGPAMEQEIPGIEKFVRLTAQDREQVVSYQDKQFVEERYCYTEPAFFELFHYPLLKGEKGQQLIRPNTVVITPGIAYRYFGETDPLGKILVFRTATTETHFEVTGVMEEMPVNSHIRFDFLLSYSTIPKNRQDIWYIHGVYTYLQLREGITPASVVKGFAAIADKYKTDALRHKKWEVELIPLQDIHLTPQKGYEKEVKGNKTAFWLLLAMAVAILAIGWVNTLNLIVARFLERGKEFGVKKAFGASRTEILLQGITEAGSINFIALVLGAGWLELFLPYVRNWTGQPFPVLGDAGIIGFVGICFSIWLTGTLLTGLYPSRLLIRIKPSEIMRGRLIHGKKGNMIRKGLIAMQFIASYILITGTLVISQQVRYMQKQSAGLIDNSVVVIKYPSFTEDIQLKVESFKRQLLQLSYITNCTVSGAVPGVEVANYFANRPYGSDVSEIKLIQMFAVDKDYLSTYALEVACGRIFSDEYGDEKNKVIVNEEAVKVLGYSSNEEALGQLITMEILQEPLQIIGVVKNYYQQSLSVAYKPILFFQHERVPFIATPYISLRADKVFSVSQLKEVEQIYNSFFPTSVFSWFYLEDFYNNQYKEDRNFVRMFVGVACLALFIACLGLWIVTLFSTLSRLKEIGVRKVLGASVFNLFFVLTSEILRLTVCSFLLGMPLAIYLLYSWLQGYAFRISLSGWYFVLSFFILLFIALLTISRQIWKVIRVEPTRILKTE